MSNAVQPAATGSGHARTCTPNDKQLAPADAPERRCVGGQACAATARHRPDPTPDACFASTTELIDAGLYDRLDVALSR